MEQPPPPDPAAGPSPSSNTSPATSTESSRRTYATAEPGPSRRRSRTLSRPSASASESGQPESTLPTAFGDPAAEISAIPDLEITSETPTLSSTMGRHAPQPQGSGTRSPQYQLVSPGTPADPRAMSQVSPGFIFVIFLSLCVVNFEPLLSL